MYVKIEPTGTAEQDGLVRVRFCMYLEEGDYGYDRHVVEVTLAADSVEPMSDAVVKVDAPKTVKQVNPFHNHFAYFEPGVSDEEVLAVGEAFLNEAYIKWAQDLPLDLVNPPPKFPLAADKSTVDKCTTRAAKLGALTAEVKPYGTD